MVAYTVRWPYRSSLGGPWAAGDVVWLGEELAEAVNRDSPGVLVRVVEGKQDRMMRRKGARGGTK